MRELVEIAQIIRATLADFKGLIELVVALFAFGLFLKFLHIDIRKVPAGLLGEFRQLAKREYSVGSFNALALILMFVLAALVIASEHLGLVYRILAGLLGEKKALELSEDASLPMFFCFGALAICSLWCYYRIEYVRMRGAAERRPSR